MIINAVALEELKKELEELDVIDDYSTSDSSVEEEVLGRIIRLHGYHNSLFKAVLFYTDNYVFMAFKGDEMCYYTMDQFEALEIKTFKNFENSIHTILDQYGYSLVKNKD